MLYQNLYQTKSYRSTDDSWKTKTLGGRVKTAAVKNRWDARVDLAPIAAKFHECLADYWTWFPKGKKSHGEYAAKLLDGNTDAQECQLAATAFLQLLRAPEPYGFAYSEEEAKIHIYSGEERGLLGFKSSTPLTGKSRGTGLSGFYSRHPKGGIFDCLPNVYDVVTRELAPLYSWSNHKVVIANGEFWDVCYNASYSLPSEMAVGLVVGRTEQIPKDLKPESLMSIRSELKLFLKQRKQIAYFRDVTPTSAGAAVEADEEGPYTESLFGDDPTEGNLQLTAMW
jgi:hypothetical protein